VHKKNKNPSKENPDLKKKPPRKSLLSCAGYIVQATLLDYQIKKTLLDLEKRST
jgi:hypothetical protein